MSADAVSRLCALLERENAALERLDFAAATLLLAEKQRALDAFSNATASAAMRPLLQRLEGLVEANRTLLRHALSVQTRVIEIVAQALPAAETGGRYGAPWGGRAQLRPAAWSLVARI